MKRILLAVAMIVIVPATPVFGQQSNAFSLRNYGWDALDRPDNGTPVIAADQKGGVVVGFTLRQRTGLVTRDQPSLEFHILRLAPDGKAEVSVSLPTNAGGRTGIYLSDTDEIIARANDSLQLLQTSAANPEKPVWKILLPCTNRCYVTQSHSRHTLLLYTENSHSPVTVLTLSERPTLQQCADAPESTEASGDRIYPDQITDEFAYSVGGVEAYRWPLCDYKGRVELPLLAHGRWTVLNDKTFVRTTFDKHKDRSRLQVVSLNGKLQFQPTLAKYESVDTFWEPISSSEGGNRIAVDVVTIRGDNRALDISGHVTARRIAVYDIETARQVATLQVNPKHHYRFAFDLSPDGQRLAVWEDDTIRLIDLQVRGAAVR
jgi:hypothetical protein